jgi:glycosyltransferase involved in cell wall biosynthesis
VVLKVSVVVPVFNGEQTLERLVDRVTTSLAGCTHEVILVNDGSSDGSWNKIVELARTADCVRGINLTRNFGQHNALLAGVRACLGRIIITLDDDLQNPPEEIPRLIARLEEGPDVVYGTPIVRRHKVWRNVAAWAVRMSLRSSMGREVADSVGPFRAFRSELRRGFESFSGPYVSLDALLAWSTTNFTAIPVEHQERDIGRSTYSVAKLLSLAITTLTAFSTLPLRIASVLGLVSTLFGVVVFAYVVVRYIAQGNPVPGFPFLASVIAIFSGAQLLALGIIGEYLARVHVRTMDRPSYAIREEIGGPVTKAGTAEE